MHAQRGVHKRFFEDRSGGKVVTREDTLRRLGIATGIALAVLLLELTGGFLSHSLALLSDAGHVFADALALGMSWFALRLAKRPANAKATFGYHRVGVLVALVNGVSLIVMATLIVREAYERFVSPVEIDTVQLIIFACLGLVANLVMVWLLHGGHRGNLAVRSAWLHVIGDSLASVGVVASGVVVMTTGWRFVDPAASVLIASLILFGGWRVARDAAGVLLEFPPRSLRPADLEAAILAVEGVKGVHDLHVWAITPQFPYLSSHLLVEEQSLLQAHEIVRSVENALKRLGIAHTTFQIECIDCSSEGAFCAQEGTQVHTDCGHTTI